MSEQTVKTPAKLPKKMIFAWPSRTIAYAVGSVLLGYVTLYATDFMGIPAATAGIIFMLSKIFDGFTDIVAGYDSFNLICLCFDNIHPTSPSNSFLTVPRKMISKIPLHVDNADRQFMIISARYLSGSNMVTSSRRL